MWFSPRICYQSPGRYSWLLYLTMFCIYPWTPAQLHEIPKGPKYRQYWFSFTPRIDNDTVVRLDWMGGWIWGQCFLKAGSGKGMGNWDKTGSDRILPDVDKGLFSFLNPPVFSSSWGQCDSLAHTALGALRAHLCSWRCYHHLSELFACLSPLNSESSEGYDFVSVNSPDASWRYFRSKIDSIVLRMLRARAKIWLQVLFLHLE